jgi:hypothetical protein
MGLLDGGIRKIIGNAMQNIFLDFQIIRKTTIPATNPWESPVSVDTEYDCKAIVTKFKYMEIDGERVKTEDRKILILAEGLSVSPEIGDYIKGDSETKRYQIVSEVIKDPAGATFVCHCR